MIKTKKIIYLLRKYIIIIMIPIIIYIMIILPFPPSAGTSRDGWLSFFGGYLGGLATLVAVLLSLEENRVERKENERERIRPFLVFEFGQKDDKKQLVIKNVGNGPAIGIELPDELKVYGEYSPKNKLKCNLSSGEEIYYRFEWDNQKNIYDKRFVTDINYKDVGLQRLYSQELIIEKVYSDVYNEVCFGEQKQIK